MRFQSPKALDLLEEAGAVVDRATEVAKLPPALVLEAMATAPRRFALGARDASCDIAVGDGRTYCTTDGCGVEIVDFADARAPPVDEGRPGGRHAAAGRALEHLVLVAHGQRRRLRRDGAAPRARRRLEQHRQAPAGDGQRRARSPLRRGDGHGHRRQRRGAPPPAGAERPHRHHLAAGRGQGRDRGGARVRRRRRAGHVGDDADPRDHGAGHQGRRLRPRLGRARRRDRRPAAGQPRCAGAALDHAELGRPADAATS